MLSKHFLSSHGGEQVFPAVIILKSFNCIRCVYMAERSKLFVHNHLSNTEFKYFAKLHVFFPQTGSGKRIGYCVVYGLARKSQISQHSSSHSQRPFGICSLMVHCHFILLVCFRGNFSV
jgi:hypothetical protein